MKNHRSAVPKSLSWVWRGSDEDLVAQAERGDPSALAEFYERYGQVAYGLALRMLREPALADAVVEDAFGTVAFGDGAVAVRAASARAWFLSVVHRKAVEVLRDGPNVARRRPVPDEEMDEHARSGEASEGERARSALALLPDKQRQMLVFAYHEGLPIGELADRFGESPETVCETLHVGLRAFQEILAERETPTNAATKAVCEPRREPELRPSWAEPLLRERQATLRSVTDTKDNGITGAPRGLGSRVSERGDLSG